MGRAERAKGVRAERELAALWTAAGCTVRGFEGQGDHLIVVPDIARVAGAPPFHLHSEAKAQKVLRQPEWRAQALAEAAPGTIPTVFDKVPYKPWWATIRVEDLIRLVTR